MWQASQLQKLVSLLNQITMSKKIVITGSDAALQKVFKMLSGFRSVSSVLVEDGGVTAPASIQDSTDKVDGENEGGGDSTRGTGAPADPTPTITESDVNETSGSSDEVGGPKVETSGTADEGAEKEKKTRSRKNQN